MEKLTQAQKLVKIMHDQHVSRREQLDKSYQNLEKAMEKYRKRVKEQSDEN